MASRRSVHPYCDYEVTADEGRQGHYDTVIHGYREVLMSNLPPPSHLYPDLVPLLDTVYALLPSSPQIQGDVLPRGALTHLLHLAPEGEILPHVDNLEASGSVILGVCLGASRMLRLRKKADPNTANQWDLEDGWDILLPNGAVYLQRSASLNVVRAKIDTRIPQGSSAL